MQRFLLVLISFVGMCSAHADYISPTDAAAGTDPVNVQYTKRPYPKPKEALANPDIPNPQASPMNTLNHPKFPSP